MDVDMTENQYKLRAELRGHEEDVRAVLQCQPLLMGSLVPYPLR